MSFGDFRMLIRRTSYNWVNRISRLVSRQSFPLLGHDDRQENRE